jgi:hypothetical protein
MTPSIDATTKHKGGKSRLLTRRGLETKCPRGWNMRGIHYGSHMYEKSFFLGQSQKDHRKSKGFRSIENKKNSYETKKRPRSDLRDANNERGN